MTKYSESETVYFVLNNEVFEGNVSIIDVNGTFERPGTTSYDIFAGIDEYCDNLKPGKGQRCLFKHLPEWTVYSTRTEAELHQLMSKMHDPNNPDAGRDFKLFNTLVNNKYPWLGEGEDECWLWNLPVGWLKRFGLQMCEELDQAAKENNIEIDIADMKEKYGELRVYLFGSSCKELNDIINYYSLLSRHVCIKCGDDAEYNDNYTPLCWRCHKKGEH